ncbi:MAG: fumarylacetoacetate hydrolase family protein [Desulfobacterales bacterium]|nr:fumarylacetoacetate hydrolase family protein [Desulfobacteraceae bacterium]MDY0310702.1 fumarylacetoacetate hydrolase family protein [Desulfobacterales bacterium]
MRLIRFGPRGQERPGLMREDGRIVDLRRHFSQIPDIGRRFFEEGWIEKAAALEDPGAVCRERIGAPVPRPGKIVCLGKNYAEHAREGGFERPARPLLFCKTANTVNGPYDPIVLPVSSGQVDWEVELAVVIGRTGKRISAADADDFIAGYTVMNDVSGRQAQFADSQWFRGKSFDGFAPMGPCILTADAIGDVGCLRLTTTVDGVMMQDGNTGDMLFDIPFIIADISRDMTLAPGDIISTGTPAGVGIFRNPPVVLQPGNVVECAIEKIGRLINPVVADQG